jgi:hypothetical protein
MGTVIVGDWVDPNLATGTISIAFQAAGTAIAAPGCKTAMVGACEVSTGCTIAPDTSCNAPNAGAVSFDDQGDTSSSTTTLSPNAPNIAPASLGGGGGWYPQALFSGAPPFVGGDLLTVTAEGGVVPAFVATIVTPSPVTLIAPAPPADGGSFGTYAIATADDLAVSWTGGESGATVHVVLTGGVTTVDCVFDATTGQGTVPQASLSLLQGRPGSFIVYQNRVSTVQTGTYAVQIDARNACDQTSNGLEGPCFVNDEAAVFE